MESNQPSTKVFNVPNSLSVARLVLAVLVGVLIELHYFLAAAIVFVFAASTDFVDGWWARKFNQVTKLGRILDPFVDKIIITAALIALVGVQGSYVQAWMTTVIIGREFLVTSIRAMVEGKGGDFSARWLGKVKMLVQCVAVVACLLMLQYGTVNWIKPVAILSLWAAIAITIASGADYVNQAIKLSRQSPSS